MDFEVIKLPFNSQKTAINEHAGLGILELQQEIKSIIARK